MRILIFRDFLKKNNYKKNTMNESDFKRVCKYPIYPRDLKIFSNKGFVNIDNGIVEGNHWTCFF